MTDIRKLCERVLILDSEATKGPWHYSTCYGVATIEGKADRSVPIAHAVEYLKTLDADLIAEYRSAAPILAREIEKQRETIEKLREVLSYYADLSKYETKTFLIEAAVRWSLESTEVQMDEGEKARRVLEETK